ncbi:MAG: alanine dehydrogenase [Edaphocola sp.]
MIIGVPKEIKSHENRVALTPGGANELKKNGHTVLVESHAGVASGFSNEDYVKAGAQIVATPKDVWGQAKMIVKVKEPVEQEYSLARKGQIIFTYFHFASNRKLTEAMVASHATCIAYETVELADGSLPLLIPMSEIAGRMAIQQGARYLEKPVMGRGVLLGGVPGVAPGNVMVLGAGIVGIQAAKMAAGLGAHVTILDINPQRLRYVNDVLPPHVVTIFSSEYNIRQLLPQQDLVVGAVLIPGAKAPHLITKDMLSLMKKGSVVVDVAVDQGGCIETCRPTTHDNPVFIEEGVVHYCVANMPGAVPYTSTIALTNCTQRYIGKLANSGWEAACKENKGLAKGINMVDGKIYYKEVAEAFGLPYEGNYMFQ